MRRAPGVTSSLVAGLETRVDVEAETAAAVVVVEMALLVACGAVLKDGAEELPTRKS